VDDPGNRTAVAGGAVRRLQLSRRGEVDCGCVFPLRDADDHRGTCHNRIRISLLH